MALSDDEVQEHHAVLRMAVDPRSPFYGMVDFSDGLLALPVEDQKRIHTEMPDDLRAMVEAYGKAQR